MADTPEMKRLADNTKIQSNVQYHAEFEATKSNFTAVVDDPGKFPKKKKIYNYSRVPKKTDGNLINFGSFSRLHFFHLTNKKIPPIFPFFQLTNFKKVPSITSLM